MAVDVYNSIVIHRPVSEVDAYATNPDNAPKWYRNIVSIEWKTEGPLAIGSRVAFVANFLGRRLAYTYEVIERIPERRFVMRTAEGPFPMETTYSFKDIGNGHCEMGLGNRGQPSGFAAATAPLMAAAMDRANKADLRSIKQILESGRPD